MKFGGFISPSMAGMHIHRAPQPAVLRDSDEQHAIGGKGLGDLLKDHFVFFNVFEHIKGPYDVWS
ncbi:hypothetical protein D9M71_757570 [compost metagenome]